MANAVTAEATIAEEAEVICALPFKPDTPELGEELLGLATIVLNAVLIGVDVPTVEAAMGGTADVIADCNAVTLTALLIPVLELADDGIGSTDDGVEMEEAGTLFTTLLLLLRTVLLLEFEMALDC